LTPGAKLQGEGGADQEGGEGEVGEAEEAAGGKGAGKDQVGKHKDRYHSFWFFISFSHFYKKTLTFLVFALLISEYILDAKECV
jgi:hypothetical protein